MDQSSHASDESSIFDDDFSESEYVDKSDGENDMCAEEANATHEHDEVVEVEAREEVESEEIEFRKDEDTILDEEQRMAIRDLSRLDRRKIVKKTSKISNI